jgi:ribokinase
MTASRPRVIVVGSVNVDLIVSVPRLPVAGETVLGDGFIQQDGGKGGNQAVAASRAGAAVWMLAAVGQDDLGERALEGLVAAGVDVSACRRLEGEHTGLALIVVDASGENQIAVASGANARLDARMIEAATEGLDPPPGSVCLIGFEVRDEAVVAAARWSASRGLRVILDPAPARPLPPQVLAAGPILTPNESEAEMLTGVGDAESAAAILGQRTGAPDVISLGSEGALLWSEGRAERLPATPVEPVDTTGAGDALNGILAAELAGGAELRDALRWAMAGAALKTTRAGARAGLPTRAAIEALMGAAAGRPGA